jgi:arsenate reductase
MSGQKKKVLFLCTGNSSRSQMAEGLVMHDFAGEIEAYSAGTDPQGVNHYAIQAMYELGIDISQKKSEHISIYQNRQFDYVITLCDNANEKCPVFFGGVQRVHMGFRDPGDTVGDPDEILNQFRLVRDDIRSRMHDFFAGELDLRPRKVSDRGER